jgi:hypothetical protein
MPYARRWWYSTARVGQPVASHEPARRSSTVSITARGMRDTSALAGVPAETARAQREPGGRVGGALDVPPTDLGGRVAGAVGVFDHLPYPDRESAVGGASARVLRVDCHAVTLLRGG